MVLNRFTRAAAGGAAAILLSSILCVSTYSQRQEAISEPRFPSIQRIDEMLSPAFERYVPAQLPAVKDSPNNDPQLSSLDALVIGEYHAVAQQIIGETISSFDPQIVIGVEDFRTPEHRPEKRYENTKQYVSYIAGDRTFIPIDTDEEGRQVTITNYVESIVARVILKRAQDDELDNVDYYFLERFDTDVEGLSDYRLMKNIRYHLSVERRDETIVRNVLDVLASGKKAVIVLGLSHVDTYEDRNLENDKLLMALKAEGVRYACFLASEQDGSIKETISDKEHLEQRAAWLTHEYRKAMPDLNPDAAYMLETRYLRPFLIGYYDAISSKSNGPSN